MKMISYRFHPSQNAVRKVHVNILPPPSSSSMKTYRVSLCPLKRLTPTSTALVRDHAQTHASKLLAARFPPPPPVTFQMFLLLSGVLFQKEKKATHNALTVLHLFSLLFLPLWHKLSRPVANTHSTNNTHLVQTSSHLIWGRSVKLTAGCGDE